MNAEGDHEKQRRDLKEGEREGNRICDMKAEWGWSGEAKTQPGMDGGRRKTMKERNEWEQCTWHKCMQMLLWTPVLCTPT